MSKTEAERNGVVKFGLEDIDQEGVEKVIGKCNFYPGDNDNCNSHQGSLVHAKLICPAEQAFYWIHSIRAYTSQNKIEGQCAGTPTS
eukprot:947364-Pelagomonas_calceolata.AAC.3